MSLWPIQKAALEEARKANGLFAPIGVGHGKTLITLLLPVAMRSKCTVLLVPPALKKQLERDIDGYSIHFKIPRDTLHILSYNDLSRTSGVGSLESINPDLIVADEAHSLRRKQSVRTKRFLRYMRNAPGTRFCALSGTMTTRSILDYAHLIELALKKNSPLPQGWHEVNDWAGALDVDPPERLAPGALTALHTQTSLVWPEPEATRRCFRERLVETQGVVATEESALGTSLVISPMFTGMIPPSVRGKARKVRNDWRVDDEEIIEATHMGRVLSQLFSGFYYKWDPKPPAMWLDARAEWHRELRDFLRYRATGGLDSPALIEAAVLDGRLTSPNHSEWVKWKNAFKPNTVEVRTDDYLQKVANRWAGLRKTGILWYRHAATGALLERDFPTYGPGDDASAATEPVIACSIAAQGTGKNMQHYHNNLLLEMPSNGTVLEQLIGRTHRPGQKADEVYVDYLDHAHNRRCLEKAQADAKYMEESTGQKQKLAYGQYVK